MTSIPVDQSNILQLLAAAEPRTERVLKQIRDERTNQIMKFGEQHREGGADLFTYPSIAVRSRENFRNSEARGGATWHEAVNGPFYEAISTTDAAVLRATLVELAAVACAWIEDIDFRTGGA